MSDTSWAEAVGAWGQADPIVLMTAILLGTIGGYLVLTSLGYFSFVQIRSKDPTISVSSLRAVARKPVKWVQPLSFLLAVIEPPVLVAALVVFMASLSTRF